MKYRVAIQSAAPGQVFEQWVEADSDEAAADRARQLQGSDIVILGVEADHG